MQALGQIEHLVRNDPFIIQLYEHNRRTEAAPDRPEQLGQPRDDVSATRLAHDAESTTVHVSGVGRGDRCRKRRGAGQLGQPLTAATEEEAVRARRAFAPFHTS